MMSECVYAERHGSRRLPWHTLVLLAIILGIYFLGGPAAAGLVIDRDAIAQGEVWRLASGHWTHADAQHLLWNLLAMGVLGMMFEHTLGPAKLYAALLTGMALVSAWVWWLIPELAYYCGLSGILNTLLVIALIDGWRRTGEYLFPLVLLAAAAKLVLELAAAEALITHTAWPAVPEAHLAGTLAGVLLISYQYIVKSGSALS